MRFLAPSAVIAIFLTAMAAFPAAAQTTERLTVNFTPAFATVGGDTETALAGSVGYRFTDHFSFEGDFTWMDAAAGGIRDRRFSFDAGQVASGLTTSIVTDALRRNSGTFGRGNNRLPTFTLPGLPNISTPIGIGGFSASADGQTMIGTLGVRYEPTVQTARFRPYLSGGLGLNHTNQELTLAATPARATTTATPALDESISHSGFALSAGGGANVRLFRALWAGADAKYFRLSRDRNIIRFGGNIGMRF